MNLIQQLLQTSIAFFCILIFARLIGKQQISQLTVFDYINGITIGSIAGTIATDEPANMWQHILDLFIFATLTFFISYIVLRNRPLRKLISGEPTIIIHNGKILEANMKKNRYNMDDLLMQLREKDVFNINDVEYAILESNGVLSVLLKSQKRSLNPQDLNISTTYEGLTFTLIIDGEIFYKVLEYLNLNEAWLKSELLNKGITDVETVMYCAIDSQGNLFVDTKNDLD